MLRGNCATLAFSRPALICATSSGWASYPTMMNDEACTCALVSAWSAPTAGGPQAEYIAFRSGFAVRSVWAALNPLRLVAVGLQLADDLGYLGAKTLWAIVSGKPAAKNVDTGTALVTKANAAKFAG
jgi:ABC-type sugar transport system substrate-binding protein